METLQTPPPDETETCRRPYTVLLPGIPVTSDRGALGWCTVALVQLGGQRILFDTGSFGDRSLLLQRLQAVRLEPKDLDAVFISHLHYDHCLNVDLILDVPIFVTARELRYVLDGEYRECRDPFVPAAAILQVKDRFQTVEAGSQILPGAGVIPLPGHTPGQAGLFLAGEKILLAGDGVKNAWEFANDVAPSTFYSQQAAVSNYDWVRANAVEIVPGHDRPFHLQPDGGIRYLTDESPVQLTLHPDPKSGPKHISLA